MISFLPLFVAIIEFTYDANFVDNITYFRIVEKKPELKRSFSAFEIRKEENLPLLVAVSN